MGQDTSSRPAKHRPARPVVWAVLLSLGLPALPSCQSARGPDGRVAGWPAPLPFGSGAQQGEVTVREGDTVEVRYKKPFQAPPNLVLLELRGADARETLYSKEDFQIIRQEAAYFMLRNNHTEHGESRATIKWHAEGALATQNSAGGERLAGSGQEGLIERIKLAGGKATVDPNAPKAFETAPRLVSREGGKGPAEGILASSLDPRVSQAAIVNIDLHRTQIGDADLAALEGLTGLRTLNLYGTKVTDAGLKTVGELKGLQTLYLNDTAVTDAGLQSLQGLTRLGELGLNRTRITDAGLASLRGLTGLHSLSLTGTQVSDAGLEQLKALRNLKRIYVGHTRVTAAGIQELKRSLPDAQILK